MGAGFGTFCEELTREAVFRRIVGSSRRPIWPRPAANVVSRSWRSPSKRSIRPTRSRRCGRQLRVHRAPVPTGRLPSKLRSPPAPGRSSPAVLPNGKGFDVVALGKASDTVDAEHLNYFNPKSLALLVSAHGLEVLEVSTPGVLDADIVRKRALRGDLDLEAHPFLKQVLVEEWERLGGPFQEFLVQQRLSTHMWLVARRPS